MSLLYEMKKTCLTKGENIYLCALFFFSLFKREKQNVDKFVWCLRNFSTTFSNFNLKYFSNYIYNSSLLSFINITPNDQVKSVTLEKQHRFQMAVLGLC